MKKLAVNKNCSGCGLCIVNSNYFKENDEGNAEAIAGKIIDDKNIAEVEKIIKECPEKAIEVVDTGIATKKGMAGIKEIVRYFEKECNNFSVKKVKNSDLKLDASNYDIPVQGTTKEYRRDYSSESSARSAARDEFRRCCYSESAYRPMIKKVFVEYKVNVLKPYYTCSDVEESAYYVYNQKIRKLLSDVYAELYIVSDKKNKLPESWKDFSVYLTKKDFCIERFEYFDSRSTSSGIIAEFKSRGEYTNIDWYVDRMDFDYDEVYAGEGLFGRTKYKDRWYFSGFYDAEKEFVDDLKHSINMVSDDIEDGAVMMVNSALEEFEKRVKVELDKKLKKLKSLL